MPDNTQYDQAVHIAASAFLAMLPPEATAQEIFEALDGDELPVGYMTCESIRLSNSELREWIENLADDILRFAGA